MAAEGAQAEKESGGDLPGWVGPLVVLLGLCFSWPFLTEPAPRVTFDDVIVLEDNPHLDSLWPLSSSMGAPPGSGASGRPLVAFSLALNAAVSGESMRGFLLFNLLVHGLAGLALFGLVRRGIELAAKEGSASRALPPPRLAAAVVAGLWFVHPLHTMALDNVVYRNSAMVGLFYFTALYACLRAFLEPESGGRWKLVAIVAALAGAASKEVAVSLPVVVLLVDRTLVSGSFVAALKGHATLYGGLVLSWIALAFFVVGGDRGESVGMDLEGISPLDYLRTQAGVLPHYLRLAFWPVPLVLDYDGWPIARGFGDTLLPGLGVLVVLVLAILGTVRRSLIGLVALSCFLILAPTSTIVPLSGALVGEHRTYLPLAGLILVVGGLAWRFLAGKPGALRLAAIACLLPWLALGATTSARHLDYWAEGASLWEDTVEKRPDNPRAWSSWGTELAAAGDGPGAERAYARAIELAPRNYKPRVNMGNLLLGRGQLQEALAQYQVALAERPDVAEVRYSTGATLVASGRKGEGIPHLREALRLGLPRTLVDPATQQLAWSLATAREARDRDGPEALRLARELDARTGSSNARCLDALAAAYAEVGRLQDAVQTARRAVSIAEGKGNGALARTLRLHLQAYEKGQAWRE